MTRRDHSTPVQDGTDAGENGVPSDRGDGLVTTGCYSAAVVLGYVVVGLGIGFTGFVTTSIFGGNHAFGPTIIATVVFFTLATGTALLGTVLAAVFGTWVARAQAPPFVYATSAVGNAVGVTGLLLVVLLSLHVASAVTGTTSSATSPGKWLLLTLAVSVPTGLVGATTTLLTNAVNGRILSTDDESVLPLPT